jgi:hypothetical protein
MAELRKVRPPNARTRIYLSMSIGLIHNSQSCQALINEETSLAAWFTEQYDVTRREFAPFLRLE